MTASVSLAEECAKAAHEVNRAYCQALGDNSQLPWDDAPEWQKTSARAGAFAVLNDWDRKPEDSHESWMAQKLAEGWTYGEVKDAKAKTHPCIVPFAELPREQQAKDYLFIAVVRQTKAAIDLAFSAGVDHGLRGGDR